MCGVSMLYRGSRFCSEQCCDFYDTGEAGPEQDWRQPRRVAYRYDAGKPMSPTMHGFKDFCDGSVKNSRAEAYVPVPLTVSDATANVKLIWR